MIYLHGLVWVMAFRLPEAERDESVALRDVVY